MSPGPQELIALLADRLLGEESAEELLAEGSLEGRKGAVFYDLAREEFRREFEEREVLEHVSTRGGDAELVLSVDYGLDDGLGAQGTWRPLVEIAASLVRPDGRVVWRRTEEVTSRDERVAEWFQPFADPERLRYGYRRACRFVVQELVDDLARG